MPLSIVVELKGHSETVYAVAVAPGGKLCATGSADNTVRLWDSTTGKGVRTFAGPQGHRGPVLALSFSSHGDRLASAGNDGLVREWDTSVAATGGKVGTEAADASKPLQSMSHPNAATAVAYDPEGTRLATGCHDGRLRIFNAAKGQTARVIEAHVQKTPDGTVTYPIYAVAWTKDGKRLVSASYDRSLKLWDAATGDLVREFKGVPGVPAGGKPAPPSAEPVGHRDQVFAAAFSPDGRHLASGSSDCTLKLWDAATGKVVRDFPSPALKPVLPGEVAPSHPGWVQALAFTPDGKRIVTVGPAADRNCGIISVWSAVDGKRLVVAECDLGPIHTVAAFPDGTKLLVGCGPKDRKLPTADAAIVEMPR